MPLLMKTHWEIEAADTTLSRIKILSEKDKNCFLVKVVDLERAAEILTEIPKSAEVLSSLDGYGVTEIERATLELSSKWVGAKVKWAEIVYPQFSETIDGTAKQLRRKLKEYVISDTIIILMAVPLLGFLLWLLYLIRGV